MKTLLILGMSLAGVLLFLLATASANTSLFAEHYSVLLGLNAILAAALLALVGYQLASLRRRLKQRVFGSRLTLRFLVLFAAIAVVPGVLVYTVSVQFLSKSIESWFDVSVDSALEGGIKLGQAAVDQMLAELNVKAKAMALELADRSDSQQIVALNRLRQQAGVEDAVVVAASGRLVASGSDNLSQLVPELPSALQLRKARNNRGLTSIDALPGKPLGLRAIVPIAGSMISDETRYLQLRHPVPEALARSAESVEAVYGDYKKLAKAGTNSVDKETGIAQEGDYPDGVIFIRSGFGRLSKRFGSGQRTLNYLGAGRWFGLREITHNWRSPVAAVPFQFSLRVLGYTHTLFVPTRVMEQVVLPGAPNALLPRPLTPDELDVDDEDPLKEQGGFAQRVGPELMEFLTGRRIFNGTSTMVIDLARCTRCDDCVRACAATHDNNPRFLRQGPVSSGIQVAQSCMHCVDPVCMIGCPTGAIHRDASAGDVVINQATCIGCTSCANNCPYDAIRMVEARDPGGDFVTDKESRPILKATKCDHCIDQYGGPACERACPHDALKRMDMTRLDTFATWLNR